MLMVSIVVPYYNRPVKIERTLNSIFNQTYKNFEVIVVDDCSDIPFKSENYKIHYVRNNSNLGPGGSRNIGKNIAKGSYIVFLDSDDYWDETFLEKTISALKNNPDVIMAYPNGYNINSEGEVFQERKHSVPKLNCILPNILLAGRPWGTGGCVWRFNKIYDLFWEETACWEDYAFDVSAAIICNNVTHINEFLIFYDKSGTGEKLSNQNQTEITTHKNLSLKNISDQIRDSSFFDNEILRNKIRSLILNNTISLLKYDINEYRYYRNNLETLKRYKKFYSLIIVDISIYLNKNLALRLMRLLRKTLNLVESK